MPLTEPSTEPNTDRPIGLSDVKNPLIQFARSFCEKLPRSNKRGQLAYKPKDVTGSAATKALQDPRNTIGEKQVRKVLKERVPNFPLVDVPSPEVRAKAILAKNIGKLAKFPEVVQQAAGQFRIPEGLRMLFIGPEYFCRDKLFEVEKFQVKNEHGVVTGVLPLCPWCRSNKGVSFRTWECQNLQIMSRSAIHTDSTRLPLIGGRYWCKNSDCCGDIPTGHVDDSCGTVHVTDKNGELMRDCNGNVKTWYKSRAKKDDHSFVIWNKKCFRQFPESVRKVYSRFVFCLAHDLEGTEPNLLPTPQLALELLDTSNTFSSLSNRLQTHFEIATANAQHAYYDFVKDHGQTYTNAIDYFGVGLTPTTVQWPDFDKAAFQQELGPPKEDGLENVFWITFQMIKPYLDRDLLSRPPGRILRWDGTRSAAKKIINIDDLDGIGTLLLITGEYGDILSYAFAKDEGQVDWQILHYFLMKRCQRMGNKVLHNVKYGYDDLGSMNYKDPSKHWFATIWPAPRRGPYKDPLHAVMLVGRSTYAHQHPMNDWFAKELTTCLLEYEKTSIGAAVTQYRSEHPNVTYELAKHTVATQKSWKRKLYNQSVSVGEQRRRVNKLYDKALAEDAKYTAEGHPPFLLRPTAQRRGTAHEIKLLLSHIERGDYQDPMSARDMSFVRRTAFAVNADAPKKTKSGLEDLARLRGTNTVESSNKQINLSVGTATRLRGELVAAKVLLRIHLHNLKKDRLFGGMTNRTAKPLFWMLLEANDCLASTIEYLTRVGPAAKYPPVQVEQEPLGLQFEHYKKYLAAGELAYLDKIHDDKRPTQRPAFFLADPLTAATAPLADDNNDDEFAAATAPPADDNDDDEYGDTAFLQSLGEFDVDAAVNKHREAAASGSDSIDPYLLPSKMPANQPPPPPAPSITPPRQRSRSSSPSPKKRYQSGGATVYNRKEGNRGLPSPIRFSVQLPLSPGQNERAVNVLNHLASSGVPKQNITATGTASAFMKAWNHIEFSSSLKGDMPLGTMPIGVAETLSKDMTNRRVKARADGSNLSLSTPRNLQVALAESTKKPPTKKRPKKAQHNGKRGRPKKDEPILGLEHLSDDIINTLSADTAREYIRHYNDQYAKLLSIRPASIPSNRDGRRSSLRNLVMSIKQSTAT